MIQNDLNVMGFNGDWMGDNDISRDLASGKLTVCELQMAMFYWYVSLSEGKWWIWIYRHCIYLFSFLYHYSSLFLELLTLWSRYLKEVAHVESTTIDDRFDGLPVSMAGSNDFSESPGMMITWHFRNERGWGCFFLFFLNTSDHTQINGLV